MKLNKLYKGKKLNPLVLILLVITLLLLGVFQYTGKSVVGNKKTTDTVQKESWHPESQIEKYAKRVMIEKYALTENDIRNGEKVQIKGYPPYTMFVKAKGLNFIISATEGPGGIVSNITISVDIPTNPDNSFKTVTGVLGNYFSIPKETDINSWVKKQNNGVVFYEEVNNYPDGSYDTRSAYAVLDKRKNPVSTLIRVGTCYAAANAKHHPGSCYMTE